MEGKMGLGAVPEHLRDFDWAGTDNASWLMRLKKKIQYRLALGPRDSSAREMPVTLFALRGKGYFRLERSDGSEKIAHHDKFIWNYNPIFFYLSRIQCWTRWHIALQWPLWFQFHWFWSKKDVVKYPNYKSDFGITKLFTFGIGYKRDADKWYIPTLNLGGNFE